MNAINIIHVSFLIINTFCAAHSYVKGMPIFITAINVASVLINLLTW